MTEMQLIKLRSRSRNRFAVPMGLAKFLLGNPKSIASSASLKDSILTEVEAPDPNHQPPFSLSDTCMPNMQNQGTQWTTSGFLGLNSDCSSSME